MAERARCEVCNRDFPSQDALIMHNSAKHPVQEQNKKSYKKPIFIVIIISVLLIGGFFLFNNKSINGNIINDNKDNSQNTENVQKITLGFNRNYYPNTISVKQGIPVEITLDSSVRGCYRSFNIKSLGVSKSSSSPSDTITFTPSKKGSFEFACGMRMGKGTIIVE